MVNMLGPRMGEDEYIVKVDKDKLVQHIPQNIADQVLEDRGALVRPKCITKYS